MLKPVKHGIDFDAGASYKKFHTYGVHWTPKFFEWYVDGKKVHRLELKTTPTTPMYVEFCHHTAEGGKVKDFMDPTNGPEPLQVDWVKVWK
jgi:beta-glucanase (GH16 family)